MKSKLVALLRPEQKDIPAAVFGKPVVAKRRRRKLGAVGSSSRGDPEVRAARVAINRVPTPGRSVGGRRVRVLVWCCLYAGVVGA